MLYLLPLTPYTARNILGNHLHFMFYFLNGVKLYIKRDHRMSFLMEGSNLTYLRFRANRKSVQSSGRDLLHPNVCTSTLRCSVLIRCGAASSPYCCTLHSDAPASNGHFLWFVLSFGHWSTELWVERVVSLAHPGKDRSCLTAWWVERVMSLAHPGMGTSCHYAPCILHVFLFWRKLISEILALPLGENYLPSFLPAEIHLLIPFLNRKPRLLTSSRIPLVSSIG